MRILLSPMSAIAETAGPVSRCRRITEALAKAGAEVATCMAEDVNFKAVEGIRNYFLDIPMPLGLPEFIAKRTFPIAQKLGITSRKTVSSFDDVLRITGNLDYKYLKKSVQSIRSAIQDFKPDFVYSEFNISAFVAAKIENIKISATVSYPTQYRYAHNSRYAKGLNRLLQDFSLGSVDSALQLFDWANIKICPSIRELEPIDNNNVIFCGALKNVESKECSRNKILVYMGNGTVPASKMLKVVSQAFAGSGYEVFIASKYLDKKDIDNIHIAPRWDFDELLHEAVCFINHGGQNSICDGLLHGVPQIVVPGKVFERKYNAQSLVDNNAGVVLNFEDFNVDILRKTAEQVINSPEMCNNAFVLGKKLSNAGGIDLVVKTLIQ